MESPQKDQPISKTDARGRHSYSQVKLYWFVPRSYHQALWTRTASIGLAREHIHAIGAKAADAFRAGIAFTQHAGPMAIGTVDLDGMGKGGRGIRVGQTGGRHVEVVAGLGGIQGGFYGREGLGSVVCGGWGQGVLQRRGFVSVDMRDGGGEGW